MELYALAHPRIKVITTLVSERYVWPSINKDCKEWTQVCTQYQKEKVTWYSTIPIRTIDWPTRRFKYIHANIVEPLPVSNNRQYCLTITDRLTRWTKAIMLENIITESIAKQLFNSWIAKFGTFTKITTNQGRQFLCAYFLEIKMLTQFTKSQHIRTTAYPSVTKECPHL